MSLYFAGRFKHMIEAILLSNGVLPRIKKMIYFQMFKIINMIQKILQYLKTYFIFV